ncbi:MAG: hypothetical protein ACKOWJ_06380 [Micrococcales bacterium]
MLRVSRILVSGLAGGFGILLGIFVLLHIAHFRDQQLVALAVFAYFVVLVASLTFSRRLRIPSWLALLAVVIAAAEPLIMQSEHSGPPAGDYDTWYVTANAILLGVIAVRGFQLLAAFGGAILLAEVLAIGGLTSIPRSGVIGAELLIGASIAISIGLQRASSDIDRIQNETLEVEAARQLASVSRSEHDVRISRLMTEVMPTLQLIAEGKKLTKQQRQEIVKLDAHLRDELAGGHLVTLEVAKAMKNARARGAEVQVNDQGGSLRVTQDELFELLETAIIAIDSSHEGDRVRLTAPAEGPYVLRLTKTRPGVVTPDLDLKLGEGLV